MLFIGAARAKQQPFFVGSSAFASWLVVVDSPHWRGLWCSLVDSLQHLVLMFLRLEKQSNVVEGS